jgi:hypothetical protein
MLDARLKGAPSRVSFELMSTLSEIEAAIKGLPASQVDELALWLEQHRAGEPTTSVSEPDFLARARAIWGEKPAGEPLSALVSHARD